MTLCGLVTPAVGLPIFPRLVVHVVELVVGSQQRLDALTELRIERALTTQDGVAMMRSW